MLRHSGWADPSRAYGMILGIRDGATKELSVSPGEHGLSVRIDWGGSKTVRFTIKESESVTWVTTSCGCCLHFLLQTHTCMWSGLPDVVHPKGALGKLGL